MGLWISPEGRSYPTPDHWEFLRLNPRLFGFSKSKSATWGLGDRDPMFDAAQARGWIRVRGKRPHLSFETGAFDRNALNRIRAFLSSRDVSPDEEILIEDAAGTTWYEAVRRILTMSAPWRPIETGGGTFIPSGPPTIHTPQGERELSAEEAARRFPGIDFGFPRSRSKRTRR